MANRRPQNSDRRMDFRNNDRGKNFRSGVSPWQGGVPSSGLPNLLPLAGGSTEATLALASNLINLLQPRQNTVPSLLDMPIRRDFGPAMGRYDRGYGPNRMGPPGNFRRTGTYNRAGERINTNRKPFRPNDGQRQQGKGATKKEADSKAKPVKESESEEKKEKEDQETSEQSETKDNKEDTKKDLRKTRYDDINTQLLKCHICNKSMWDGRSFENHLSGRAHAIMMQKTAESYALTADTMRQEFKIREMKRTRKTGQQPGRDFYCAMCNIYAADGAIHRTTMGHRKLKKYLHPTCTSCHKEMPTRIELDEHRLTPEHLRNLQDKNDVNAKPKPEVMVISTLDMEQKYLRDDRQRRRRRQDGEKDNQEQKEQQDEAKEGEDQQQTEEEMKEEPSGDVEVKKEPSDENNKSATELDTENTIIDYKEGDDLSKVSQEVLPTYSIERGVGHSFLAEFRCYQCKLCNKLLDSVETADVHLRTWKHHQLFVRMLMEKSGMKQGNQEATKRSSERNPDEPGSKRPKNEDEEHQDQDQNGLQDEDVTMIEDADDTHGEDEKGNDGHNEDMPAEEELEDWDQSCDDSNVNEEPEPKQKKSKPEPEPEPEPVKEEKPKEKTPPPAVEDKPKSTGTPRGRGRGRGRARGRY